MTVSVSTLAERALRRLNVTVVPLDDRPTLTEMVPVATIATMALVELGIIASDEAPIPSDQALALDKVASVHAALDAQGLVWWDGTAIPRAFVEEFVKLVAAQASSSFGKATDPAALALLEGRGAPRRDGHRVARHRGGSGHGGAYRPRRERRRPMEFKRYSRDGRRSVYEQLATYNLAPKFPPGRAGQERDGPGDADAVRHHRAAHVRCERVVVGLFLAMAHARGTHHAV